MCFGWRNGWSSDSQHKKPRAASGGSSGLSGYLQDCLHGSWSAAAGGPQGVRGENQPAPLGDGENLSFNSRSLSAQKSSQKADEYLRELKEQSTLEEAVEQCVGAARYEYDPQTQKSLLRVIPHLHIALLLQSLRLGQ